VSTFELLAAIDLRGGCVVRLRQGDFARETVYDDDPARVAKGFADAGARWLHVVDLDGARAGEPRQTSAVRSILESVGRRVAVEIAGGLRDPAVVEEVLGLGAARVVVGTAAVRDPGLAGTMIDRFGADRVAIALDVRGGRAVGEAWQEGGGGEHVEAVLDRLAEAGATTFEVTAIDRDGLLAGPDLALLARLVGRGHGGMVASAGIASLADLIAVRDLGCVGAIVGRALYEGRIDLAGALAALAGPAEGGSGGAARPG
jgi:phosphoribosylformimino-5-aminoimidazole carboxamide ribotide isomerase